MIRIPGIIILRGDMGGGSSGFQTETPWDSCAGCGQVCGRYADRDQRGHVAGAAGADLSGNAGFSDGQIFRRQSA